MTDTEIIKKLLKLNEQISEELAEVRQLQIKGLTKWLCKKDAATYIGMSATNLSRLMADGAIPYSKATTHPKFKKSDLDRFLERKMVEAEK